MTNLPTQGRLLLPKARGQSFKRGHIYAYVCAFTGADFSLKIPFEKERICQKSLWVAIVELETVVRHTPVAVCQKFSTIILFS